MKATRQHLEEKASAYNIQRESLYCISPRPVSWMIIYDVFVIRDMSSVILEMRGSTELEYSQQLQRIFAQTNMDIYKSSSGVLLTLLFMECLHVHYFNYKHKTMGNLPGSELWRWGGFSIHCLIELYELYDERYSS